MYDAQKRKRVLLITLNIISLLQVIYHSSIEELYKYIDNESLPREYLPDHYEGPHAGTLQDIKGTYPLSQATVDICRY